MKHQRWTPKPKKHQRTTKKRRNVTGTFKAPHSRAQEVIHRYNALMGNYQHSHPNEYTVMVNSTSMETDGHVTRMLHALNVPTRTFEDDVLFMVRYVWTTATKDLEKTINAKLKHLLDVSRLLFLLRDRETRTEDLIAGINSVKAEVIKSVEDKEAACCILTCPQRGQHSMNSRPYCNGHFGLALFNGLRHDCKACHVWSLLALKLDITGGHMHNSIQTLDVPLIDKTTHMRLNVRLKRFCGPLKKGEVWGPLRFHRGVFQWGQKCTLAITMPITKLPRTSTRQVKVDWCRTIPSVIKTSMAAQRRG